MGLEKVATFRASGNVIFATPKREGEGKLATRVEAELDERLGYDVPVFLRSEKEIAAIAARKPFTAAKLKKSKGKLQVSLLKKKPGATAKKRKPGKRSATSRRASTRTKTKTTAANGSTNPRARRLPPPSTDEGLTRWHCARR